MMKIEMIVGGVTVAGFLGAGILAFGQFQGRLVALERDHATAVERMEKAGQKIIERTEETGQEIIERTYDHVLNLYDKECYWLDYMPRLELTNIQECPEGFYAKGLGFYHPMHANYTYQMSYRLRCCSLTAIPPEE